MNRLAELRARRGISAAELASSAGVARQTIYAIEGQSYMPNTAVALRLARTLEVAVEELFQLEDAERLSEKPLNVDLLLEDTAAGRGVHLCAVGKRVIAVPAQAAPTFLPVPDGLLSTRGRAVPLRSGTLPARLLIGGCDPALSVLAEHARQVGVEVTLAPCNSSQALQLLRRGRLHIAGVHSKDNASVVRRAYPRDTVRVVTFAVWQQGFVVSAGNPKDIRSAADLMRGDVRIANREVGAGSRLLLDRELEAVGLRPGEVKGYDRIARGHLAAAWQVVGGLADCCVATEAAARAFGLDFVPLTEERFDLVLPKDSENATMIDRILDAMQRPLFRRQLGMLAGYDTAQTGDVES
jgi:molybdate-binding protein/DNA-binding XRE family transcriptional regulator